MNRQTRVLTRITLSLLMASAPFAAYTGDFGGIPSVVTNGIRSEHPVVLAQAEGGGDGSEEELLRKGQQQQQQQEQAPAAAEQPPAPAQEPQAAPEAQPAEEPVEQPAPQAEPTPDQPEAPTAEQQVPDAPAEPPAEPEAPVAEPAPEPDAPAASEEPAPPESAPDAQTPTDGQQAPDAPTAPAAEPETAVEPLPETPEAPAASEQQEPTEPAAEPKGEAAQKPEPAQAEPAPSAPAAQESTTAPEQPGQIEQPKQSGETEGQSPDGQQGSVPANGQESEEPDQGSTVQQPADQSAQPDGTTVEGQAPVLDSQKQPAEGQTPVQPAATSEAPSEKPAAPTVPAPADDRAAQEEARPAAIQPATAEEGRRIELKPEQAVRERPQGAEVVREFGYRTIVQINNQVIVESNDRPRIARDAREVYYEELPRGRVREVIVREDGSRVVTIRDRYGDIIRRSRFTPDDREYILVYVDEGNYDRVGEWRDPGLDLPPMLLTIPVEEYILDAERVDGPDAYYAFLDQPPVERVERLYSVDEVRRSARIRDKVRRIDMDTINFEFGSAEIAESEIGKLEDVATAMERLLKENPAETFLIEGHTDAVGSGVANLALSDRRAEAVAEALTNVFAIAPENLAPQGYGEQYLKVRTQSRERENRRVAIRRITPLVAPVATAD